MDSVIYQKTRDQLAEYTSVYSELVNSGFGNGDNLPQEHVERCAKTLLSLEELICDHVEQLRQWKGQVT